MPVTMPTCNPSAFELACCLIVRSETFYRKTFFACQVVATVLVILRPLFVTNAASYGAAGKVCYDRNFAWRSDVRSDVDSRWHDPEWDMDDVADWHLFPSHLFNSISTGMSLFGFWVWLFYSPYNSDVARALDRTCAKKTLHFFHNFTHALYYSCISSFSFSGQLLCPSVVGERPRCCDSVRAELCTIRDSKCSSFSYKPPCIDGPFRHRDEPSVPSIPRQKGARHDKPVRHFRTHTPCLIFRIYPLKTHPESPNTLTSLSSIDFLYSIDDVNDPSVKYLELLEGSLVWEARSLWFVAVGAPAFIVYRLVGLVILGLGVLVVVMMVLPLVYSHPSLVTVSITGSTVKFQSTPPLPPPCKFHEILHG